MKGIVDWRLSIGLILLMGAGSPAAGQHSNIFIAWSPCFPDQLLGGMIGGVPGEKGCWFLEVKGKKSGVEGTEYDFSQLLAEDIFEDAFKGEKESITTVRVGRIIRVIKEEKTMLGIYFGLGIMDRVKYRQYHDRYEILDPDGNYYIKDDDELMPSPALGIMTFGERIVIKFGLDIYPTGFSAGIGYIFGVNGSAE